MFSVSGVYLSAIADWLHQSGYGSAPLCARIRHIRTNETLTLDVAEHLLNEASLLTNDSSAALRVGQIIDWPHLGALGHMISSARTLEELLNSYVHYEALFYGTSIANLSRDRGSMTLYWKPRVDHQEFSCFSISSVITVMRRCGVSMDAISAIFFPSSDASKRDTYAEILQCENLIFGQTLGLTIRREFLGREILARGNGIHRDVISKQLFPEIYDEKLALFLYNEIVAGLPQREVSLKKIASIMAVSPRTLQRRLSEIPDGLRGAIDRVRMHLAAEYLKDDSMTLIATSLLLGYSEQSAFHLAFRRQFGVSPRRWRRENEA